MDAKPFWMSKTIWANVISLLAMIGSVWGLDVTPEQQATILSGIVGIAGVVNLVLRKVTKGPIR